MSVRPLAACVTVPDLVRSSLAGTPKAAAAARTIISRPAAPTRRNGSQLSGAAVLPPAVVGFVLERRIEERLGTPATLAAVLLAGAGALVLAGIVITALGLYSPHLLHLH